MMITPDAQYVLSSFILRVALDRTETELLDELAAQVLNNHLRGTNLLRLGPDRVPVLLLPHISQEADDLISLVEEPAQNAAGVETTCMYEKRSVKTPMRKNAVIGAKTNQNKPDKLGPSSLETMVKAVLSLYSTIDVFTVGRKIKREK
jgi:hypothetical protein